MIARINHTLFLRIFVISSAVYLMSTGILSAQYDANVMKAAYLERITRFIEWPPEKTCKTNGNFVIGVYGDNEFYNTMVEVFKNKTIKDRNPRIIQVKDPDQVRLCNVCYVSGRGKQHLSNMISIANKHGVLMISETKDFGEAGIHINFYVEEDKFKFEINKKSIDTGKFKVSSMLMKSAKII